MLGHGESEHAVITRVPRALLDHQVLGVDVEGITELDQDEEEEQRLGTPEPLHDEAEDITASLTDTWSSDHIAAYPGRE